MTQTQVVTIPVLDTRVAQLEAKIESVKAELVRWVVGVMLGNVALNVAIAAALLSAFQHSR